MLNFFSDFLSPDPVLVHVSVLVNGSVRDSGPSIPVQNFDQKMKNHRPVKTIPKSFQFITELLFSECKLFSSESISIHIVANNSVQWVISFVYSSKHVLLNIGLVLSSRGPNRTTWS